jgi:hypothetical protein
MALINVFSSVILPQDSSYVNLYKPFGYVLKNQLWWNAQRTAQNKHAHELLPEPH